MAKEEVKTVKMKFYERQYYNDVHNPIYEPGKVYDVPENMKDRWLKRGGVIVGSSQEKEADANKAKADAEAAKEKEVEVLKSSDLKEEKQIAEHQEATLDDEEDKAESFAKGKGKGKGKNK